MTSVTHDVASLGAEMLQFASSIERLATPEEVLDALHRVSSRHSKLNVLVAGLMPIRWGDWSGFEQGKTVFLHSSAPEGWWDEWRELTQQHPPPGLTLAQISFAPFITSELMQTLEPLGVDRWSFELAQKYGMRDGLTCPVGGRWVISFWSSHPLSRSLSDETRAILFMGATFAAIRLQKLVGSQVNRLGKRAQLTPRELAVLRLLSLGHQTGEVAALLGLGEETIRSHLKKVQSKLGVRNRTQAVAQAIRYRMIP